MEIKTKFNGFNTVAVLEATNYFESDFEVEAIRFHEYVIINRKRFKIGTAIVPNSDVSSAIKSFLKIRKTQKKEWKADVIGTLSLRKREGEI